MKTIVFVALVGVFALRAPGCRRKREAPAAPAPEAVTSAEAAAATQPPATAAPQFQRKASPPAPDSLPTAPADASLRLPVQQELTGAIHLYQMDHQRLPADFTTLVREKYLPALPNPPPGKRFALDRNRLQVVIMD